MTIVMSPVPSAFCVHPGTSYALIRSAETTQVQCPALSRRNPKFRLGFSNAAINSPWRVALVHSVEYGAAKYRHLVSSLAVRHADQDVGRQATDIAALVASGVDGLILSAHDSRGLEPVIAAAERRGVPTVLVDRGLPDALPHASFVTLRRLRHRRDHSAMDSRSISAGAGGSCCCRAWLPAEPAQRRLAGALGVFPTLPRHQRPGDPM